MKYTLHQFDSIHKFIDAAAAAADKTSTGVSNNPTDGWHGTADLTEAIRFAKFGGWAPEGAAEMRRWFDGIVPKIRKYVDNTLEYRYNVSGASFDIARYLDGEPECMFEFVPNEDEVSKRALCLVVGYSIPSSVTAQQLFARGQALIGLVRALATLGYELEIWAEESVRPRNGKNLDSEAWSVLTRLHSAGTIMDESAVEFALGNPSWLRRLIFALQEGESPSIRKRYGFQKGGGYGTVTAIQHANIVGADLTMDLSQRWFTHGDPADAERWVFDQLKALGVVEQDAEFN